MSAVLEEIGHLIETELSSLARHDGGVAGEIDGTELELEKYGLVVAELAGTENFDANAAREPFVDAAGELVGRLSQHGARRIDVTEAELDGTGLRAGAAGRPCGGQR